MYGKKVKLRALFIFLIFTSLSLTSYLIFKSLEENVVYFKSPSDVKNLAVIKNKKIRVGGMVKLNSVNVSEDQIFFIITDFKNDLIVNFKGSVPNLFEEGKGVVAEGFLNDNNYFRAVKILAKHDENYMPPEVNQALKNN